MKTAATLNPLAAAISVGILWALTLFITTLISIQNGYAESALNIVEGIYPLYEVTTAGAFWGLLFAFLDGFIGTYILIWLYNQILNKIS